MLDLIRAEPLVLLMLIALAATVIGYVIARAYGSVNEPRVLCNRDLDHHRGQPDELWIPTSKDDD